MSDLALLALSKRLTLVTHIGDASDGDSLRGQNVNLFPDGALFYVAQSNRFYALRKGLASAVVATGLLNVVDGIGSSDANGRFVAVEQRGVGTLTGGTTTIAGWDLSASGFFLVSYNTPGGTQGFLRAAATAANIVTITSSSGSDTSSVNVVFVEAPRST